METVMVEGEITLPIHDSLRVRTGRRAFDIRSDEDGTLHIWVVGSGKLAARSDGTSSGFVVFII